MEQHTEEITKEPVNTVYFTGSDGEEVAAVTFDDGSKEFYVISVPEKPLTVAEKVAPPPPEPNELDRMRFGTGHVRAVKMFDGRKEIQIERGVGNWVKLNADEAKYFRSEYYAVDRFLNRNCDGTDLEKSLRGKG